MERAIRDAGYGTRREQVERRVEMFEAAILRTESGAKTKMAVYVRHPSHHCRYSKMRDVKFQILDIARTSV